MNAHFVHRSSGRNVRKAIAAAVVTTGLFGMGAVEAAPLQWTGGVDANWSNTGNWSPGQAPGTDDAVTLPGTGTPTPTTTIQNITSGLRLDSLTINSTATNGWTIGGSGALNIESNASSNTLISTGATQNLISTNVQFVTAAGVSPTNVSSGISVATGNTLKVTGDLTTANTSTATLRLSGGGTLWTTGTLTASNTGTTEAVNINGSTLKIGAVGGTLATSSSNGFRTVGNATLIFNGATPATRIVAGDLTAGQEQQYVFSQNLTKGFGTAAGNFAFVNVSINAGAAMSFSVIGGTQHDFGTGTLNWNPAVSTSSGIYKPTTLKLNTYSAADATIRIATNFIALLQDGMERTIEVGDVTGVAIDAEISGAITGSLGGSTVTNIRKTGAGTLLLSGANSLPGTYSVTTGTLLLGNTNANISSIANSANLGGTGAAKVATISGAGTIRPGNATGTGILAVGALNTSAGSDFAFDLGTPSAPAYGSSTAPGNDVLRVLDVAGISALAAGNLINVNFLSTPSGGDVYLGGFFTTTDHATALTNATFNYTGLGVGQTVSVSTLAVGSAAFSTDQGGTGSGYITRFSVIVPEPGSLSFLGLIGLGLAQRRRSRKSA